MDLVKRTDSDLGMFYLFSVAASLFFHWVGMQLDKKIITHAGNDDCMTFSYVPELKIEDSILYEEDIYPGYATRNNRVRVLIWTLDFIPFFFMFHLSNIFVIAGCSHLKYFFSYGKRSENLPEKYINPQSRAAQAAIKAIEKQNKDSGDEK